MTSTHWGASPTDWAHLADKLGLESDLLPVVADTNAKRSPNSKIQDPGKVPSRFNQNGEMVGIPKWTLHVSTGRDIARWQADSRLGICIQTRRVKAFDIDIGDPVHAKAVADMLELTLGTLPTRGRNNSGKRLLAFVLPVDFPKRIIRTAHGNIELLSTGQQFIAVSTHPSGARYEWIDSDGVIGLPDALPELTMAEVDVAWQALIAAFALPDGAVESRRGLVPAKPRVAADGINDPVVSFLEANGWVTEYERDGKVHVRCPWQDEHTTDSGPSATTWFPAGVGGYAQGHFKCQHAHCLGRDEGDLFNAIGYVADDFDVVTVDSVGAPGTLANAKEAWPAFTRARNGQIEAVINNVLLALRRPDICGMRILYDEFKAAILVDEGDGELRPFHDRDYTRLTSRLELGAQGFKPIERSRIRDAVGAVAWDNRFDSAMQWIASLKWDGVPRVESFFARYFKAPDTPYSRAVGLYTWTALAGRCLTPGEKTDMVPVLVGPQNAGKTTGVRAIAPHEDTFTEVSLEVRDDDLARKMRGTLVGEIGELRGLDSRDEEAIKQWVTRTHEEWTPKYMEYTTKYARRLVLFGTTNRDDFLVDDTGNRRWLPLRVGQVDVPAIRRDCEQLWAEGRELYEMCGIAWQGAYELAKAQHAAFKATDAWDDVVTEWLARDDMDGPRAGQPIRVVDVLVSAIGLRAGYIRKADEMRCSKVLARLGFQRATRWVEGRAVKVWVKDQ